MLKRIVATALSSVIVFSLLIVPSYASLSDADSLFQVTDIFDWAIDKAIDFGGWLTFFQIIQGVQWILLHKNGISLFNNILP